MACLTPSKQADLKSISLAGLLAGDVNVTKNLVEACKVNGFFYLDFRHESTCDVLKLVDELTAIGKAFFTFSLEEKEEYSTEKYLPSRLLGYKRAGCSVGPFAGKRDGYESFSVCSSLLHKQPAHVAAVSFPALHRFGTDGHAKIHNNGIFGQDDMMVPPVIDRNLRLFEKFMGEVHSYTDCILSILSNALNLSHDLKDCHRKDKPSAANMAMLRYLAWGSSEERIGNMAHTDMGTLTVVFSKSDGLQAMLPGDDQWSFISPRAGHAVVNVGDSLRFLSSGALASSLHRVVPPPDSTGQDKFSVIYFLRPEFEAKFTTHDGKQMNSVEWHNQKYALFREASLDAKQHGAILTGRQEYLGATEN